ncbi:O-antigen ligase family protein [Phenylobacterium sp.]|uniref:O-antigen ligase family protein n=1 Tax=Phenylobacterium sp. TaxID=1871053 RepID=UPI003BAC8B74
MSPTPARPGAKLAAWCGWVLAGGFVLTPIIGWLAPLTFAPLLTLMGLLTLPAVRVEDEDRPVGIAVVTLVLWAAGSSVWSPFTAKGLGDSTAAKLIAETVVYFAAVCAARAAAPGGRTVALNILAYGTALLGVLMLVEGLTGAMLYRAVRDAIHDPIRPDLGIKNAAQGLFILAMLAPPAALAAVRVARAPWLIAPMLTGLVVTCVTFGYDAPLIALAACLLAGLAVWRWPGGAPKVLAAVAATFFLTAPAIVWAVRRSGWYAVLERDVPLSWSQRMGYWRHAADWISDHPLRGWGLDASRMFNPGIKLHPHDAALQIWLELGLIGAMAAAVFWVALLAGMSRKVRDPALAVSAATATAYLTFNAFSFGVWQEWWLATGALAAVACAALQRQPAVAKARAPVAARPSTPAVFSE